MGAVTKLLLFVWRGKGGGVQGKQLRQENEFSKVREITEEGKAAGKEDSIPFQTLPLFDVSPTPMHQYLDPNYTPTRSFISPLATLYYCLDQSYHSANPGLKMG